MEKTAFLLLADDDLDDCSFFKEALDDLPISTSLSVVNDGVALMNYLSKENTPLPDLLFLDLNMPLKGGFECLEEIKNDERLKKLPVVICSTSMDADVVRSLYEKGATYYIRKPGEFSKLRDAVHEIVERSCQGNNGQPAREAFVLDP